LDQKWVKTTYGDFGLTVETPVKLAKGDLPVPENVRQLLDKMDAYNYLSAKGFKILITSIRYSPSVGSVSLEGAADGASNEVRGQKGVSDFTVTQESINKNGIAGIVQKGSLKQNGTRVEFLNAILSQGLILWQVWVGYESDDEVGRIAAKRVIDSIEIKSQNQL